MQSEASRAHQQRKLITVIAGTLNATEVPPPFDNIHAVPLDNVDAIVTSVRARLKNPAYVETIADRVRRAVRRESWQVFGLTGSALTFSALMLQNPTEPVRILLKQWSALNTAFWSVFCPFRVTDQDALILSGFAFIFLGWFSSHRERVDRPRVWAAICVLGVLTMCLSVAWSQSASANQFGSVAPYFAEIMKAFSNLVNILVGILAQMRWIGWGTAIYFGVLNAIFGPLLLCIWIFSLLGMIKLFFPRSGTLSGMGKRLVKVIVLTLLLAIVDLILGLSGLRPPNA